MSQIALSPNPAGNGTFTIAAPNSNTNRTLTLPDNTGTVLTSASSLTAANLTGRVPAANAPSGSVIQVVQTTLVPGGGVSISSGAGATTVMSLAITPSSATSRIMVCVSCHLEISGGSFDSSFGERILRGATEVYASGEKWFFAVNTQTFEAWSIQYVDSPNTTSSTTYNFQIVPQNNRGNIRFGRNGTTTMQLLEIAG